MRTKKGFTLIELSLVLAVSAIAMAMLSFAIVQAKGFTEAKQRISTLQTETENFQKAFSGALEDVQSTEFVLESATSQSFVEFSGVETCILKFENKNLWKNNQSLEVFHYLSEVQFSTEGNVIRCVLEFEGDYFQTLVFVKRA